MLPSCCRDNLYRVIGAPDDEERGYKRGMIKYTHSGRFGVVKKQNVSHYHISNCGKDLIPVVSNLLFGIRTCIP